MAFAARVECSGCGKSISPFRELRGDPADRPERVMYLNPEDKEHEE